MKKEKNIYEIVVFGAAGVGKTSIIRRFYFDEFTNLYEPTIEDCYSRVLTLDGKVIVLNTTDTSGSYQFPAMRRVAIQRASGFIMVYSLDNKYSFDELKRLLDEVIDSKHSDDIPVVLVGNKRDMDNKRELTSEEVVKDISEFIRMKGASKLSLRHVETSAKDNYNVKEIFREILDILSNSNKSSNKRPNRLLKRLKELIGCSSKRLQSD